MSKAKNRERFLKYAEPRVNHVLGRLNLLGQISLSRSYEYTEEEIDKMFDAINAKVKLTESLFRQVLKTKSARKKYDADFKL
ncbi:MAG: hypothetical protein ABI855_12350 [Bacteroidota bacterium]